jgi:hypothetical protein
MDTRQSLVPDLRVRLALCGTIATLLMVVFAGGASEAKAAESNYCWGSHRVGSGAGGRCVGAQRELNALYGQGTYHSVCVWATYLANGDPWGGFNCSPGPGAGTYYTAAFLGSWFPVIQNNAAGTNVMYGVAFRP